MYFKDASLTARNALNKTDEKQFTFYILAICKNLCVETWASGSNIAKHAWKFGHCIDFQLTTRT